MCRPISPARASAVLYASWVLVAAGCGQADWGRQILGGAERRSMVSGLTVAPADLPPALESDGRFNLTAADARADRLGATAASAAVVGQATFRKSRIFGRDFLYGFDLQYSSGVDGTIQLLAQSQAQGHVPAFFRRVANQLQLVADQRRLFESVVNHPEQLLATYRILGETEDELVVAFESGGIVLNELANAPAGGAGVGPGAAPTGAEAPKQVWVRSLTYVEDGDYLLQETGLLLKNGTVQTFMESVFPRSNLVPDGYVPLVGDGAVEPKAARYRFLTAEKIFVDQPSDGLVGVRKQTEFVSRYNLGATGTIDFYVTPNAPDALLPVLKSGVEGWNRYFGPQLGRNVLRFLGRLPADIKLGDPRYNIINFDSVAEAGAAYESSASDPFTGIQSHSLIYMPYAWYNIGADLWKKRTDSVAAMATSAADLRERLEPKGTQVLLAPGRKILACVASADAVALPASALFEGALAETRDPQVRVPESVDEFSRRLMMSTLFHEVGHALGLAHNFKGSLAFDSSRPESADNPTSYSVMDYNYYQLEQGLFTAIGGSDGPKLEYDRQIINQLYHDGKDLKADDPVIAACEDGEADGTEGGVDPLCVRYDAEKDPSLGLNHAYHNLVAAEGAEGVEAKTLSQLIVALTPSVAAAVASPAQVGSVDVLTKVSTTYGERLGGLAAYFLAAGAQSVRGNLLNNSKSMRLWKDGVSVDEVTFRSRYVNVLQASLQLTALPDAAAAALESLIRELVATAKTNMALGATEGERAKAAQAAADALRKACSAKVQAALTRLRSGIYETLKYDPKNPFAFFTTSQGIQTNLEDLAVRALAAGVLRGLDQSGAASLADQPERLAAAKDLASFKGVSAVVDEASAKLAAMAAKAQASGDARQLAAVRAVAKLLSGDVPGPP